METASNAICVGDDLKSREKVFIQGSIQRVPLILHALSKWQDVEQPTAMGKTMQASTAEYFLGSV